MIRKIYFLLVLLFPIILMVIVNETSPPPSFQLDVEACTRHCHNHGCTHAVLSPNQEKIYAANIEWLKHNPLGLSYQEMNLLLYVLLIPLLTLISLWGLIRKRTPNHA